jgi:hypothetical protein
LVSPLKFQKRDIKKDLDFLNDMPPLVATKQNVDTNLNTLIDLPNGDYGATTSSINKGKGAGLIDNDEHVIDSPTKKLLKMKFPITMNASDALPSSLIDSNVSLRQTQ